MNKRIEIMYLKRIVFGEMTKIIMLEWNGVGTSIVSKLT